MAFFRFKLVRTNKSLLALKIPDIIKLVIQEEKKFI